MELLRKESRVEKGKQKKVLVDKMWNQSSAYVPESTWRNIMSKIH
jgi:hypothetical protein